MYPGISIYNADRLGDDAFVEAFVARLDVLDSLLNVLRSQAAGASSEHQILIGQRGMGKSALLRRVAIAIARDKALSARFIPLRFREEQYNVLDLSRLWRNVGESLAEWCEASGRPELAARLDRAVDSEAWRDAETAADGLLDTCREIGGRPVLLLDNLDLIVDALKPPDRWRLRGVLQRADGPVVIGAATRFLAESGKRDAPFYEFFHPHLLEPLTADQLLRCLGALADLRQEAGRPVKTVLAQEPERLLALYSLTGGNPRVLALIYQLLERTESDTIFADLESLLDQVTPFYKARIEDYTSSQQRAVIDAIALNWDPITSHDLSRATGIEVTTISSHLSRMKKTGFVQEVPTSGARAGYQLAERFLNIWYLMRHGTRRTRQKLRWLTILLTRLYSAEQLGHLAEEVRGEAGLRVCHPDFREAVLAAWEEMAMPARTGGDTALERFVDAMLDETASSDGAELQGVLAAAISATGLDAQSDAEGIFSALDALVATSGVSDDPAFQLKIGFTFFVKALCAEALERDEEVVAAYDKFLDRISALDQQVPMMVVAQTLHDRGIALARLGHNDEAVAAYDEVVDRFGISAEPNVLVWVARALVNRGVSLGELGRAEEAVVSCDEVLDRFGESSEPVLVEGVARALFNRGYTLAKLGRLEEAIAAFSEAMRRFNFFADPVALATIAPILSGLGPMILDEIGDPGTAEIAYRRILEIDDDAVKARRGLAWVLLYSNRAAEAADLRDELAALDDTGLALLDAGFALAGDNFGSAVGRLEQALDDGFDRLNADFLLDLIRLLRLAAETGHGDKLIDWFEAQGYADRYAPIIAAFTAHLRGEKHLLDVNPEVRDPARQIYDRLRGGGADRSDAVE